MTSAGGLIGTEHGCIDWRVSHAPSRKAMTAAAVGLTECEWSFGFDSKWSFIDWYVPCPESERRNAMKAAAAAAGMSVSGRGVTEGSHALPASPLAELRASHGSGQRRHAGKRHSLLALSAHQGPPCRRCPSRARATRCSLAPPVITQVTSSARRSGKRDLPPDNNRGAAWGSRVN